MIYVQLNMKKTFYDNKKHSISYSMLEKSRKALSCVAIKTS